MSDQPQKPPSDEPEITGGWQRPSATGGWQPVQRDESDEGNGGWQVVKAMPSDLDILPTDEGGWHLPRPEDTTFNPEDEIEISQRPESADFSPAAAPVVEDEEEEDDDLEAFSGLSELVAMVSLVERQPQPSIVLHAEEEAEADAADAIEAALAGIERSAPAPGMEDDEPDFSGASAEREALSRAAGVPHVPLTGLSMGYDDEEEAEEEVDLSDPAAVARQQAALLAQEAEAAAQTPEEEAAAYAREQLDQLGESDLLQATEILDDTGHTESEAAAYAREQLEQLGVDGESRAAPVDPAREALAQKFLDTEAQVRGLRMQYQNNQLSRDELQNELRKLLILDDEQQWWMMGVDTDTWYRYDNDGREWVADTPPRPTEQPRTGAPTETSDLNPVEVLGGRVLPYLDDREFTERTDYDTLDLDDGMGVRSVPIHDPDATIAGAGGVYMDTMRRSDAQTLEGTQAAYIDPTVPHDTLDIDSGAYIPVPSDDDSPPSYDTGIAGESYEEALQNQRRNTIQRMLLVGSLVIGGLFVLGTIFVLYVVTTYNNLASEYREQVIGLADYEPPFQTARILDSAGNQLAEFTSQTGGDRTRLTSLNQISPELIYAIVALEDPRYFENPGYDPIAIGRAFVQNLGAGEIVSGASTITQQIASNLILQDSAITADNKLREIIIASEIAQRYTKNEILLLYLNEVFFGNQSYGVEAAAQFYFDKPASQINLTEGALLASLIAAPASRDPVTNRAAAFAATDNVLRQIAQVPCLNFAEVPGVSRQYCINPNTILNAQGAFTGQTLIQRAQVQAREYLPRSFEVDHPHFVFFVLGQLEQTFGSDEIFRRGFVVRTTLNTQIQEAAEEALQQRLRAIQLTGVNTGAVMVTDPTTGAIRAMVGSPDFNNPEIAGQVNNVFTWQQPGSTIKPILYAKVLEGYDRAGDGTLGYGDYLTPASILWDVPTRYTDPPYEPVNFDRRFRGPVSVRYALANSLNIPAVKAFDFIGAQHFVEISRRLGLTFEADGRGEAPAVGRPSAVGATEVRLYDMMQAYGILANNGNYLPLFAIESITDSEGNQIAIPGRPQPERRLGAPVAYLLQNILSDDVARADTFGTNSILNISQYPGRVAAKTGTTNDNRDLWTMGFSRNLVVGVWIGSVQNTPTTGGSVEAARIWNTTMTAALAVRGAPPGFENPGNVAQQTICALTGTLPAEDCPSRRSELFIASQPPPPPDQGPVVRLQIDTWSFQRANEICPDNLETRTFVNIADPFAIPWLRGEGAQTARLLGLPQDVLAPPASACDLNTILPTARIASPADATTVEGIIQITGAASAPNFARYELHYAPINTNNYTPIGGAVTIQQTTLGAVLGEWDTRTVPNGDYVIRLSMFATAESGGGYLYRTTRVRVQNIPPTPTPTLTPPPSPTPEPATPTVVPVFPTDTPFAPLPTLDPGVGFPTQTAVPLFPTDTSTPEGAVPFSIQIGQPTATPTITIN